MHQQMTTDKAFDNRQGCSKLGGIDIQGLSKPALVHQENTDPLNYHHWFTITTTITTTIIITTIITNITIIITSPASLLLNCWWLSSVVPSWTKWPPGSKPLPVENKFQISFKITLIPIQTIHDCVFVFTDDQSNVSLSLAMYTYCHFTPVSLEFSETRDVSIVPRLCKTKFDLETCESSTVAKKSDIF